MANNIKDADFQNEVVESSAPVLVDFWAEWCGPCRQLGPVLDELDSELEDVKIVKMNIDENPETPSKHGVRSIPTLILFKDGKPLATKVGAQPKGSLKEWIESEIA